MTGDSPWPSASPSPTLVRRDRHAHPARLDGDEYVITGAKRWISNGGHADHYLVYCRLHDQPGAKGIGALIVPADTPGLTFGERERLMGWRNDPVRRPVVR